MINVLITGGGGYLGSKITPLLLEHGYQVTILDRFFFGKEVLGACVESNRCKLLEADTRWLSEDIFNGVDAILDLAALSNDPSAELDQNITLDINFRARIRTATLAKKLGVKRYILASSCSVYGFRDDLIYEETTPSPISTYAKANLFAEHGIMPLSDNNFSVTALRQGTLYGLSPRMRFDVVLNAMALSIFKDKKVIVHSGEQWRPIVHVEDAARAFLTVLDAEPSKTNGKIFNVGSTEQNFRICDLAALVVKTIDIPTVTLRQDGPDVRSYRVSFEKIKETLGYKTLKTPEYGAQEIYDALRTGLVSDSLKTKTLEWYKKLLTEDPTILSRVYK